jgi:hypothetical protein
VNEETDRFEFVLRGITADATVAQLNVHFSPEEALSVYHFLETWLALRLFAVPVEKPMDRLGLWILLHAAWIPPVPTNAARATKVPAALAQLAELASARLNGLLDALRQGPQIMQMRPGENIVTPDGEIIDPRGGTKGRIVEP